MMASIFLLQRAAPTPVEQIEEFEIGLVWQTLTQMGETLLARVPYIVVGLFVFFLFWLVARIVKRIILKTGERTRLDLVLADLLGRLTSAGIMIAGFLVAAVVIFPTFNPGDLIAGLGITSVAIGFAFKDILQNFLAGVLLLWQRPFNVGDQIRTMDYEGTVEAINVRETMLKTYDGERVILPNGDVYTSAILVRTAYPKRRVRFEVGIGYPDSIEEARAVIHRVLRDTEGVMDDPGPWVFVTELAPSSVNLAVFFWVEPLRFNLLQVTDRVATGIKLALDAAGIDMPYPHRVVLFHNQTGGRAGDIEEREQPAKEDNAAAAQPPRR